MNRFYVSVTNKYCEQEIVENFLDLRAAIELADKIDKALSDDYVNFDVDVILDRRGEHKEKIEAHVPFFLDIEWE